MGGICAICRNTDDPTSHLFGTGDLTDPVHYFTVRVCYDSEMIREHSPEGL